MPHRKKHVVNNILNGPPRLSICHQRAVHKVVKAMVTGLKDQIVHTTAQTSSKVQLCWTLKYCHQLLHFLHFIQSKTVHNLDAQNVHERWLKITMSCLRCWSQSGYRRGICNNWDIRCGREVLGWRERCLREFLNWKWIKIVWKASWRVRTAHLKSLS